MPFTDPFAVIRGYILPATVCRNATELTLGVSRPDPMFTWMVLVRRFVRLRLFRIEDLHLIFQTVAYFLRYLSSSSVSINSIAFSLIFSSFTAS